MNEVCKIDYNFFCRGNVSFLQYFNMNSDYNNYIMNIIFHIFFLLQFFYCHDVYCHRLLHLI